jgi:rod shape-determining protein MreD
VSEFLHQLDRWLYAALPGALVALLILLTLAPIRLPDVLAVAPLLPLMAVYHFCLFRADALPAWLLFVLGIVFDLLQGGPGTPVGVSALQFLLVRQAILGNQKYLVAVSFTFIWLGYAILSAVAVTLSWFATALLSWRFIDPQPALFQYIVSLFLYPIFGWVLGRGRGRDPLNEPGGRP